MEDIKQIIKQEYVRCSQDPAHFMRKYVMIQHPTKGRVEFNLYPFQAKVLYQFQKNDNSIVLKSRQLGISTLIAGYSLWLMLFHKDKNVLVLATKQDTAKNLITKVRFAYENLPSWLKGKEKASENNKLSLKLANGSQIKAVAAAGDAGRSEAVSLLVIDEAAFIERIDEIFASAQQTVSTGGKIIALSTPNGVGGWFHRMWTNAEMKDSSTFVPIKLNWKVHPERDQNWRDKQDKDLGIRLAAQECFSEDVVVYTKTGSEYIKDIKVKDLVLTHDGTYQKIKHIIKHKAESGFDIKGGLDNVTKFVTSNHPFYTESKEWKTVQELYDNPEKVLLFPNHPHSVILDITPSNKKVLVYNFEVENNNSYVTEYGIVHNCDCDFSSSGETVFRSENIEKFSKLVEEPIMKRELGDTLWIWEAADYSKDYMLISDVARGDGKDFSTCHVFEINTMVQVAEFRAKLSTRDLGHFLVNLSTEYNNGLLIIENNTFAWDTVQTVIERGYKNLYYSSKGDSTNHTQDTWNHRAHDNSMIPGFTTSNKTRPLMIDKLREYIQEDWIVIKSARFLAEMKTFIYKNDRPEAQSGYNDDLIIPAAIGVFLRETAIRFRRENISMTKMTLSNIKHNINTIIPSSHNQRQNNWVQNTPYGDEDFSWILNE